MLAEKGRWGEVKKVWMVGPVVRALRDGAIAGSGVTAAIGADGPGFVAMPVPGEEVRSIGSDCVAGVVANGGPVVE